MGGLSDKICETDIGLAIHPDDVKEAVRKLINKCKEHQNFMKNKYQEDYILAVWLENTAKEIFGDKLI